MSQLKFLRSGTTESVFRPLSPFSIRLSLGTSSLAIQALYDVDHIFFPLQLVQLSFTHSGRPWAASILPFPNSSG
jgi:hypothetical protein